MGRRKDISIEEKTRIMLWAKEGIATAKIAAQLGRHRATIRKHVTVLKSLLPSSSFKRRPGGHRKITDKMKDRLRRHILQHPFKSAKQLRRDVIG
jgi:IS30 family transposase